MLYAISWFLVLVLLAIWSTGVWVLHSFAVWSLTGAAALIDRPQQIERLPLPEWLALWLPPDLILAFRALTASVLPWVEASLSALPSASHWLTPLAWISWAVGLLILVVVGVALTALISMTRKAAVQ